MRPKCIFERVRLMLAPFGIDVEMESVPGRVDRPIVFRASLTVRCYGHPVSGMVYHAEYPLHRGELLARAFTSEESLAATVSRELLLHFLGLFKVLSSFPLFKDNEVPDEPVEVPVVQRRRDLAQEPVEPADGPDRRPPGPGREHRDRG